MAAVLALLAALEEEEEEEEGPGGGFWESVSNPCMTCSFSAAPTLDGLRDSSLAAEASEDALIRALLYFCFSCCSCIATIARSPTILLLLPPSRDDGADKRAWVTISARYGARWLYPEIRIVSPISLTMKWHSYKENSTIHTYIVHIASIDRLTQNYL